ncbi:MAG TPA: Rieske (2Fe-2S) protein [Puia sp.]|nr:Rieske (2Fe-2S) protein [Puia sp.]HWB93892.1 Rieske (2Fe-2S) protein [Puia sp.]
MKENKVDERRRKLLIWLGLGLSGLSAAFAGIPILASVFAPLLVKVPPLWRPVADLQGFEIGTIRLVTFQNADPRAWAGSEAHTAAWLRRDAENAFTAFSANCTHLGCPVRWEKDAELFMCPCHGGVYYKDGTVAAGPPPRSLRRYPVRINKGKVEIQTSPLPLTPLTA